jgi:hypothetical protein
MLLALKRIIDLSGGPGGACPFTMEYSPRNQSGISFALQPKNADQDRL